MKKLNHRPKNCLIPFLLFLLIGGCSAGGTQALPLQDDFEDSDSGWGTDQREEFIRGYEGGEYFIELRESNWFAWAYPSVQIDDVNVTTDAYLASGSRDGHFGVLCRYVDEDNFYYFAISADGYYGIFRRENGGNLQALVGDGKGMLSSPVIQTGGRTNTIRAVCHGNDLSLYVNDELLERVSDDAHTQGNVGLGAGSGTAGDSRVQFDNLSVTGP
ncbi:MAG: hypothetical protein GY832_13440 [Chloroflexi bacterium]|nr:hypothetical protein [Chloroflexota bacterium]